MRFLAVCGTAVILAATPAAAADIERTALLIGNGDYENAPDALTAARDVRSVAEALRAAGWDVTVDTDLDRDGMREALAGFAERSDEADDVLIYYSGHALRSGDATYLAPIDQAADSLVDVMFDAVPLALVMRIADEASGQGVVLIDGAQLDGFAPSAFADPGLAEIEPPEGVFVVSAAAPGLAIRRNPEADSHFARTVVGEFLRPGTGLVAATEEVGAPIWVAGSADADFVLAPEPEPVPEPQSAGDATGSAAAAERALDMNRARVRQVQRWLTALGFDTGSTDGLIGPKTREALRGWESASGREVDGYVSAADLDALQQRGEAALAEQQRAEEQQQRIAEAEDDGYWAATGAEGTAAGYRAYLDRYPEGKHAVAAHAALAAMSDAEADVTAALRNDEQAWSEAEEAGTAEALRDYIAAYPEGIHHDEARARLDEIEAAEPEVEAQPEAATGPAERAEVDLGLNDEDRLSVEQRLRSLGFGPGPLDGRFDNQTRVAIADYQADRGIEATGYLDQETLSRIVQETSAADDGGPGRIVIDGTRVIRDLLDQFGETLNAE